MKKKSWIAMLAVTLLIAVTAVFATACGQTIDYTVTVYDVDEATPLQGITVSWEKGGRSQGKAQTNEDGEATATLSADTYDVVLSGMQEGLTYTAAKATKDMNELSMALTHIRVVYTATVIDKNGNAAQGVTVRWANGTSVAGTATTDASGKATCELNYADYAVTISSLPEGNIFDGALSASGKNASAEFRLQDGVARAYTVTARSEGGLLFADYDIFVYRAGETTTPVASGKTNDTGVYTFTLVPGNYTVQMGKLPAGYTSTGATLSASDSQATVVLKSAVITEQPTADTRYAMGSIIHDYSFTTPYTVNGKTVTYTISELLKTKKAVVINNWGTNCTWCVQEMPAMNTAYLQFKDDLEILAVSNYTPRDSDSVIVGFREQQSAAGSPLSFPMMRDTNDFATKFGLSSWPATVVIDRYGAVARIESGAILDAETWAYMFGIYTSDDYTQTFTPGTPTSPPILEELAKPDITLPDDHYEKMAVAVNNTAQFPAGASVTYYGETKYEFAWPFLFGTVDNISPDAPVLYSSNTGKASSMSFLYATVKADAGKVFTFEYYADCEETNDNLSFVWDGKVVRTVSGHTNGWKTCYLYADITSGEHTLSIAYRKNSSTNEGTDNVYIRNVHFADIADIDESTDMLRSAAYGNPLADGSAFTYYAPVSIASDGYYHVDAATLPGMPNNTIVGNDNSPMLFVNVLGATNWNSESIRDIVMAVDSETDEYATDCTFTVNGVTKDWRDDLVRYLQTASASEIDGFLPVDEELHDLLVAFMAHVNTRNNANMWLEACYFYSHYGTGDPVGNPIIGLTEKTAIEVHVGENTAVMTHNMAPFPITIHKFTPEQSGVYLLQSHLTDDDIDNLLAAQAWLYDDDNNIDSPLMYCGDNRDTLDGSNLSNFEIYYYMQADHTYYLATAYMQASGTYKFSIAHVGDSASVLTVAAANDYRTAVDENGNMIVGRYSLRGAVKYVLGDDKYYHAVNPDGSVGSIIYLSTKYPTNVIPGGALKNAINSYDVDPAYPDEIVYTNYKIFDFRTEIQYYTSGEYTYRDFTDITNLGSKYRDYTQTMQQYINRADENGLVKVDATLASILNLYFEVRANATWKGEEREPALENEWLRFCWYYRTCDQNNP